MNRLILIFLFLICLSPISAQELPSLKKESFETLRELGHALLNLQITDDESTDFGAIRCPECNVLHTRAAEAVYPFAVIFKETNEIRYKKAAIDVVNWLIKQQQPGGEWIETPWQWTGTTADQLLMIVNSFPILKNFLSENELVSWKLSIKKAADFLVKYMSPDFASINYCPTSAAVLAQTYRIIPDDLYLKKAKELARWTVAKMDEDGFIQGEAARSFGVKYGVDLGYEMDMSLWGLALYAKECKDNFVEDAVRKSLKKNLNFIYPNGAIDASWGSRCYKWTTFGSKTADGCQILFSLFANEDPRYYTAAIKNLRYLKTMIKDGLIGNGPHFWNIFPAQLCNYPTFARAKNLALTFEYGIQTELQIPELPSEIPGWMKFYPTVDVTIARSKNIMLSVSAYEYKDLTNTNNGQYNQHPTGGSACNVWVKDFGFLQTSSQTKYIRGEVVHMPAVADTVICLTPRIEFTSSDGYFTNLYEFEGRMTARSDKDIIAEITTAGELKNEKWMQGGVGYKITHTLKDDYLEKTMLISFHDRKPLVKIIEPIVQDMTTKIEFLSSKKVLVSGSDRKIIFEITDGDFNLETSDNAERFVFPFPAMKCYPLMIKVEAPSTGFVQKISYRMTVID
ncbi:MAG: hypothetical protein WC061_09055 [Melioribacteraceae bacterium]